MTGFMTHFASRRRIRLLAVFCAGAAVSACVDTAVDMGAAGVGRDAAARQPQSRLVARPGVSPRGASVALTSVDGASEATAAQFKQYFSAAAEARDIVFAPPDAAQYRIRGYVTAAPAPGGARVSYVWDVFDRNGRRAQRIADELHAPAGGESQEAREDRTLAELARRSAEDIASFLSNTPEAIAAANGEGAGLSVVTAERPKPAGNGAASPGFAQAR